MRWRKWFFITIVLFLVVGCVNIKVGGDDSNPQPAANPRSATNVGWKDVAAKVVGKVFLGAEEGIVFYAFDVLTEPNEPVELVTRLQEAKLLADIPDATVGYYLGETMIGQAKTDSTGHARFTWQPAAVGDYTLTAKLDKVPASWAEDLSKLEPVSLVVSVKKRETRFVVIDLDHTVVDSSFIYVLLGSADPMPGSVDGVKKIAENYSVIYLTHRPDLLTHRSKIWLREHGYPLGVLLVSPFKQSLGGSGEFKSSMLADVRIKFPNILVGIGDKISDAQAYVENGMEAYLIPYYKHKVKDMRRMAELIRELAGTERLQVVRNWQEIELGLFQGRKYSPEAFARWLDKEANRLEEEDD
jgi:hypothetical protein